MDYWKSGINKLIEQGMTINQIAEACGLSASAVYDIRNGYTQEPKGIAAVRMHDLFGGAHINPPN